METVPKLYDLVDQLSNLYDAYESLYLLIGSADDIGADRVSMLILPVNDALSGVLRGFEKLLERERIPLLDT